MSLSHADRVTPRPRRFWTAVAVEPAGERWAVKLDGRAPRSPLGAPLTAPTRALADAMAAEWAAQGSEVDPATLPLSRLAFTALDRGAEARGALADELARYAGSDTLAYHDEGAELGDEQRRTWGPWLDWAARDLGVELRPAAGVMPQPQSPEALARVRALALVEDDFALTGLAFAAALFGSAVLAFALRRGALGGEAAHDLARLEQAWQERRWGEDAEAAERTAARLQEARQAERWFRALDPA